jgi:predicted PurR-regulated permease PerM
MKECLTMGANMFFFFFSQFKFTIGEYPICYNLNMINGLEERIEKIESRNKKVELDKAWEISFTRKFLIAIFTYLAVSLYFLIIKIPNPWINAIVPTIGFLLSTLTLAFFKNLWRKFIYKK